MLCVNNGPHLAPLAGGYIAPNLSWRWCFFIPGIIQAGFVVILFFTFPETLYSRTDFSSLEKTSYIKKLFFHGKVLSGRSVAFPKDFLAPYRMCQYVAVTLPAVYWATANTYGSALFTLTGSRIAAVQYNFNVAQTGLLIGIPLTISCMIGETSAG
jgi:MFS family permease